MAGTLVGLGTVGLAPGLHDANAVVAEAAVTSGAAAADPSPDVAVSVAVVPRVVESTSLPIATAPPPAPSCRAAILVHGGGYFAGDAGALEASFAAPLRASGYRVWNVEYPMLADSPDVRYDASKPWYPRPDVDSTPAALRTVHDRAVDAIVPTVVEALATACRVTLVGVSAGGSIVADLAHRFPDVDRAVLVVGASLTPDRIGGAPLDVYYGAADEVVLPRASTDTCARWVAAGSVCVAHRFEGDGHLSPGPPAAALASLLAAA